MLLFKDFIRRFAEPVGNGEYEWNSINKSLLVSLMSIGCLIGSLSGA